METETPEVPPENPEVSVHPPPSVEHLASRPVRSRHRVTLSNVDPGAIATARLAAAAAGLPSQSAVRFISSSRYSSGLMIVFDSKSSHQTLPYSVLHVPNQARVSTVFRYLMAFDLDLRFHLSYAQQHSNLRRASV